MGHLPRGPYEVIRAPPQGWECGRSAGRGRRLAAARHLLHIKAAAPRAPPGEQSACITCGADGDCHVRVIDSLHPVHFTPGSHHVRALPPRHRCGATPVRPRRRAVARRDQSTDAPSVSSDRVAPPRRTPPLVKQPSVLPPTGKNGRPGAAAGRRDSADCVQHVIFVERAAQRRTRIPEGGRQRPLCGRHWYVDVFSTQLRSVVSALWIVKSIPFALGLRGVPVG